MKKKKPERTKSHPQYGELPLVCVPYRTPEGKEGSYWTYDLTYQPPLPRGAVRGDPARQNYCQACNAPKFYYVDEQRRCVDCGEEFTFWAKEQKYWYETLRFILHSTAIRCVGCRKARRSVVALQNSHAEAVRRARSAPQDPCALLALAEAAVEFHAKTSRGDLARALAAARKARQLDPNLLDSHYWEAALEAAAGRSIKARDAFDRFLAAAEPMARYALLLHKAKRERRSCIESLTLDGPRSIMKG